MIDWGEGRKDVRYSLRIPDMPKRGPGPREREWNALPEVIRSSISLHDYINLPDHERLTLVQSLTTPDAE